MSTPTTTSDEIQRARYEATRRALNDAVALAKVQHTIDRLRARPSPALHVFGAPKRIRGARHVGLFAGSFNPLTEAHDAVARAARITTGIDLVLWVHPLAAINKETVERATLVDRLVTVATYLSQTAYAETSAMGLLNRGLYVDQARLVREYMSPTGALSILIGFDKVVQIFDARYYDDRDVSLRELFSVASLLVAPRGDMGMPELEQLMAKPENLPFAGQVRFLPVEGNFADDSSTEARRIAEEEGAESRTALRSIVTPEGLALIDTGAYRPPHTLSGEIVHTEVDDMDSYTWRQLWIRTLAASRAARLSPMPSLSALVAHTMARDDRQRRLRHSLVKEASALSARTARRWRRVALETLFSTADRPLNAEH